MMKRLLMGKIAEVIAEAHCNRANCPCFCHNQCSVMGKGYLLDLMTELLLSSQCCLSIACAYSHMQQLCYTHKPSTGRQTTIAQSCKHCGYVPLHKQVTIGIRSTCSLTMLSPAAQIAYCFFIG